MSDTKPFQKSEACESPACSCGSALPRRDFLRLTALSAAGLAAARLPAVAGPFTRADFEELVPADKRLRREWLHALTARGEPTSCRGDELRFIGMPVGGLCAGQLYLGGDGRLWLWDIFNQTPATEFTHWSGPHYAKPPEPFSPIEHGFALRIGPKANPRIVPLDRRGFRDVTFCGQYPVGRVDYADPDLPVRAQLEAFSPFVPLDFANSSLPATILEYTVENRSGETLEIELAGWIENAACLGSGKPGRGSRRNRLFRERRLTLLHGTAEAALEPPAAPRRADILFDDFERERYERWTAEGTAFGDGPIEMARMPDYQGQVGGQGKRVVNTHNTRQGENVTQGDEHVGTLTSAPFAIERHYVNFLIGGGAHADRTCVQLLVGGQAVLSATGRNDNRMLPHSWDVRKWAGQSAQIRVVDRERGGWGNIGLDDIVFSDTPRQAPVALTAEEDFGSIALALLARGNRVQACTDLGSVAGSRGPESALSARSGEEVRRLTSAATGSEQLADRVAQLVFAGTGQDVGAATRPFGEKLVGSLGTRWRLKPGARAKATFVVAWHFPAVRRGSLSHVTGIAQLQRSYARRFGSAADVARYVARNFDRLAGDTRLWRRTWYEDSTLPHWFLERTFLNNSIAATATCLHFDSGRFYGWEGTYCCAGTCQHVWQYAQGLARVFPELERAARELTDYGIAFHPDTGALDYRAEADRRVAIDGQAGTVLRVYREHQMSANDAFLRRLWPRVRLSVECLMRVDANSDGVLEGEQYNTLDASWYGRIPWLSSLYLAALRAAAAMAREMGDNAFAQRCERIADRGGALLARDLFNGEYFIHQLDPAHAETINTNDGCHIDQVYGQSWAFQVGLPRVLPSDPTRAALEALWRYNFTPDIGPYRSGFTAIPGGRWYAMPGEGGLLMCTWPKGGAEKAAGKGEPGFVAYFNECMTGFEYQVAGHMLWEGLTEKGLAVARMIHDRYHATRRNPWNEVECSSHYARAVASHGVYLAACGFEYHGPKAHLGFAPRIRPEDFQAAFTAAEGWGSLTQKISARRQSAEIRLRWGRLRLRSVTIEAASGLASGRVRVQHRGKAVAAEPRWNDSRLTVRLDREIVLAANEVVAVIVEAGA